METLKLSNQRMEHQAEKGRKEHNEKRAEALEGGEGMKRRRRIKWLPNLCHGN